jgi:hypothetical protein
MTSERDFDRIARAWLESGPHEAPDRVVNTVMDAIDAVPQVRRPRWWLWRPTPMTRLPMLAVLAGLIVLALGAVVISSGRPTPAPIPSQAAPSAAASAVVEPSRSPTSGPIPADILGTWIAPLRDAPGINQAATSSIAFRDGSDNPAEPGFALELGTHASLPQEAMVDEVEPGVIRMVSRPSPGGCQDKDVGRYRWSKPSPDVLELELVSDACAAREAVVPGAWIRSGIGDGDGGPGIAAVFSPFFEFTLPPGRYEGIGNMDADFLMVDGDDGSTLTALKDPDGFVDPCSLEAGRIDLDPGIDPFVAYLSASTALEVVDATETTIDGNRAVRIDITTRDGIAADGCADGNVLLWVPHSWPDSDLTMPVGGSESVIVTEVDGATVVFTVLDASGAVATDVVESIRFIDELPMP